MSYHYGQSDYNQDHEYVKREQYDNSHMRKTIKVKLTHQGNEFTLDMDPSQTVHDLQMAYENKYHTRIARITGLQDDIPFQTAIGTLIYNDGANKLDLYGSKNVFFKIDDSLIEEKYEVYNNTNIETLIERFCETHSNCPINMNMIMYNKSASGAKDLKTSNFLTFLHDSVISFSAPVLIVYVKYSDNETPNRIPQSYTMKRFKEYIAETYQITDFYLSHNGRRLPEDATSITRHITNIENVNSVVEIIQQTGIDTVRLRYICQNCGSDVWRGRDADVRCIPCAETILFKTRPPNNPSRYIAR